MVGRGRRQHAGPRRIAQARLLAAVLLAASASATNAQPAAPAPPAAQMPVLDNITVNKLVWYVMAALDQANRTGNYSVLRDLGAPSFQAQNSAATLGGLFAPMRTQGIDLSWTLAATPVFQFPPAIVQGGLLRARGVFPLRPSAIGFDLLFQDVGGQWQLFGISVVPVAPQAAQAAPAAPPAPRAR